MKKIGIYGGTFDPVHHAHLILAREAVEQLNLERLIFIPAATSPFKEAPAASAELRLLMLRAAIADEPKFEIDDLELHRPPPSYSIDTIEIIRKREADAKLYLLIGEDNTPALNKWHRFSELKQLVRFVVLDRTGTKIEHEYEIVQRKIEISATDIRNRVASGRSIRYLVPPAVEEIIRQKGLYREGAQ